MLEEAIVHLLLRHNCVVVPAFGGFVAKSSGAIIDMNTGVISPPRKSILFNRQLVNNDGLLITHLSAVAKWEYNETERFLLGKVSDWQTRLKQGERVVIEKIGQLYLDAERNIGFEQDRYFNLLLQSYGLNKVHFISEEDVKLAETNRAIETVRIEPTKVIPFVPVIESVPLAEAQVLEKETAAVIQLEEKKSSRKLWKYAAAAALLPFAFYTYWIPVETNVLESGMISFKDFNPTYQAGEGIYQQKEFTFSINSTEKELSLKEAMDNLPVGTDVFYYKFDDKMMIPVKMETQVESVKQEFVKSIEPIIKQAEPKIAEIKKPTVVIEKSVGKKIHYITGCFSDRANAESMVATLRERGLDGYILDVKNGMTRVSAGSASNDTDFEKIKNKVQAVGYKGWKLD